MKKILTIIFIFMTIKIFPLDISIEGGYLNSTNEKKYDGWYIQSALPLHQFSPTFYISGEPFIHIADGTLDPGVMINLNKDFLLSSEWKIILFGGLGFMYLNTYNTSQHDNFNFKENIGIGLSYTISPDTEIILRGTLWHISNAGITDNNPGIDGNTIGIVIKKSF